MASAARRSRVASLDVFLTAPGRQAGNAAELVAALSRAAGVQARVLTKEEEGTLAYRGAMLTAGNHAAVAGRSLRHRRRVDRDRRRRGRIGDPDWIESVDLGSVRLTTRAGDMQSEAEDAFAHLAPPRGRSRARRRRQRPRGAPARRLGARRDELAEALRIVETTSPREVARRFGVDRARAEILPAGVILLAEVQRKLGVSLHVCGGGIREGAVLASLDALAA